MGLASTDEEVGDGTLAKKGLPLRHHCTRRRLDIPPSVSDNC